MTRRFGVLAAAIGALASLAAVRTTAAQARAAVSATADTSTSVFDAGGVHVILGSCPSLAPDALRSFYEGWTEEEPRRRRVRRSEGLVLAKPACPPDTGANPIAASI